MQDLTLRYRHGELPAEVASVLRKKADRLARKYEELHHMDVLVDVPHRSQRKGNETVVRITAHLPKRKPIVVHGNDLDVVEQGQNVFFAIDQAFEALDHTLLRLKSKSSRPRVPLAETILGIY
jgi:ribosome-associated translation inhibitor RaiA